MGSATTAALGGVKRALDTATGIDLGVASELFSVAGIVGGSSQLSGALADWSASPASREKVVADVFGDALNPSTVRIVSAIVVERWSNAADLVNAIEEAAIRAASIASEGADVEGELFGVSRTVADNPSLELALGSRVGDDTVKGALVAQLLADRVTEATRIIAVALVQQMRGRRIRPLLARAERIVADQRGRTVATVHVASPLSEAQADRLRASLSSRYGESITLNVVIEPDVVGGLRVKIADDVIDASVASRLADLRQRLAG